MQQYATGQRKQRACLQLIYRCQDTRHWDRYKEEKEQREG